VVPKLRDVHCAVPTILPLLNWIKLNSTMNELNIFTPFLRFQHDNFLEENKGVFGLLPTAPWLAAVMQAPLGQAGQVQQPLDWFPYPYRQAQHRNCLVACTAGS